MAPDLCRIEMESDGEAKPHLCTSCGEAFTTTDALHAHKETEHPDEPSFQHHSEFPADTQENKTPNAVLEMDKTSIQNVGDHISTTERENTPVILDGNSFQSSEIEKTPNNYHDTPKKPT